MGKREVSLTGKQGQMSFQTLSQGHKRPFPWRRALAWVSLVLLMGYGFRIYNRENQRMTPQPRGIVLGLYAGVPDYDYKDELRRIAESGAQAVSLQAIYRMERYDSVEVVRHPTSSPTEESLRRTFRQAKALGLRMMFFPTINLRNEAHDPTWWRGNIQPKDWNLWWKNYTDFNVKLAQVAEDEGVEWFSLGTEMATTHAFPYQWRQLAKAVKAVFKGKVTYSLNFDSHDGFAFGDCLDVIGMNTYDPISKQKAMPSAEQVRDAWWWIVTKARTLEVRFNRPVMVTEIGYPSVAGAHAGPWDFRSQNEADPELQKHLVEGALQVLRQWTEGHAVFYYLYGENLRSGVIPGGPSDRTYAPWGKPVESVLHWYFQEPVFEGAIPASQQNLKDALAQSLEAAIRKDKEYEDAPLPEWVKRYKDQDPDLWQRIYTRVHQAGKNTGGGQARVAYH